MELLGDLERAFAATLYPLRVPLAVLAIVGVVALLWVARRRGWFAAARRHPALSGIAVVVVVAVALPVGWYLASPLLIRTELQELPPAVVSAGDPVSPSPSIVTDAPSPTPAASAGPESSASADPASPSTPDAEPSATPAPTPLVRSGTFTGADDFHFGQGRAILIETAPGQHTLRFEDFSVRNGPDLYVYLSPDAAGYADGAIELGQLRATDGSFNTTIPDGTDVTSAHSVVIWCKQFAVQFAVAPLDG
jgi:hypothetical protein